MTTMTRVQAEALAAFVVRLRTDWRPAGVVAALEKAAPTADAWDVARALLNLASEPTVQTPGLLDKPGPHWRKPDGDMPGRRGDHNVHCPEHPLSVHPCPQCEAKKCDPTPDYLEAKAALRVTRPRHDLAPALRDQVAANRLEADEYDRARELAEQEANR